MKLKLLPITLALFSSVAFAENIQGSWKMLKTECASGAPDRLASGSLNVESMLKFTADQMLANYSLSVKWEKPMVDAMNNQLQAQIEETQKMAEGPEKQAAFAKIDELQETIQKFEEGVKCDTTETDPYTFDGSVLHIDPSTTRSSNCPGDDGKGRDKATDSLVEFTGNVMKATDKDPVADDNSSCPKGDKEITTFVHVE